MNVFKYKTLIISIFIILINLSGCVNNIPYDNNYDNSIYTDDSQNTTNVQENSNNPTAVPDFSNIAELRNYINRNYENDILNMSFTYSGSEDLTTDILLDLITIQQISYTYDGKIFNLTLTEYVGDKIIRAYKSRNNTGLNKEEIQTLNTAKNIVKKAKKTTRSPFELELYIHDYITSTIDYSNNYPIITDAKNPPHEVTVVGALLDGKANCQGYADAFYVLGTMAGFDVSRFSVTSDGNGHMVNTILLDGSRYIVDTTFNDSSNTREPGTCSYMAFNIGKDLCLNYEWSDISEYHEISPVTDEHFYYFSHDSCIDFGYKKVFYNIEDMTQEIYDKWNNNGIQDFHLALLGKNDFSQFSNIIYDKFSQAKKSFSYSYVSSDNSRDTFIHFTIN